MDYKLTFMRLFCLFILCMMVLERYLELAKQLGFNPVGPFVRDSGAKGAKRKPDYVL